MTNFLPRPVSAEVGLVVPEGWSVTPQGSAIRLPPGGRGAAGFRVRIPASYAFRYPRVAIAADVTLDGRMLGQIAEATVERRAA